MPCRKKYPDMQYQHLSATQIKPFWVMDLHTTKIDPHSHFYVTEIPKTRDSRRLIKWPFDWNQDAVAVPMRRTQIAADWLLGRPAMQTPCCAVAPLSTGWEWDSLHCENPQENGDYHPLRIQMRFFTPATKITYHYFNVVIRFISHSKLLRAITACR